MIGSGIIEGESQELLERDPIVDLGFQFGIGVDFEPLLQEEAFQEDQRRIGIIPRGTFSNGIMSYDQMIDTGPVHDRVDLFHSLYGPVLFDGREERQIGKGEIGFHLFEAHGSSGERLFEGIMAQKL
jgi:hypothetical protein